jgi:hypothetical protein
MEGPGKILRKELFAGILSFQVKFQYYKWSYKHLSSLILFLLSPSFQTLIFWFSIISFCYIFGDARLSELTYFDCNYIFLHQHGKPFALTIFDRIT